MRAASTRRTSCSSPATRTSITPRSRWRSSDGGSSRSASRVAILAQPDWRSAEPVARAGAAEALLRRQRRQHGLDDQPLHGEPEAAERRRVLAGRPHRAPARSADARLLPALPRGLPRRAGHRGRGGSLAAAPRALRLLVGHGAAVDPRPEQVRPARARHGRARHPGDRRAARRGRGRQAPARHAGRGLSAGRERGAARRRSSSCRARRRSSARTHDGLRGVRRRHAHDPPRDQPAERAASHPAPRRPRRRGEPARDAARRARDGRRLRAALPAHAAPVVPRGNPRRR